MTLCRMELFRTRLTHLLATSLQGEEQVFLSELVTKINEGLDTNSLFGTAEATATCEEMQALDQLLISDGIVYII
jgi:DNA replication licensing factor MCM3